MIRISTHHPSEPAQALVAATLHAACELGRLPVWFERHALPITSPAARQVLWAAARRVTGNPDVGFAMAARVPEDAIGSLWQLYEVAPSLRALWFAYESCSALLLDFVALRVVDDGELTWLRLEPHGATKLDRAEQDFRCAMLIKVWRRLQQSWSHAPLAVHFSYSRPSSVLAHEAALGTRELRFSQPTLQLAFPRARVDAAMPGADGARFERELARARQMVLADGTASLAMRTEELITEHLASGTPAHLIARELGLSERSLRRALRGEGSNYRDLLTRVRIREGALFLEAVELSIERVAQLLGFANGGALRNGMRRWSKLRPTDQRRSLQRRAPDSSSRL